jgi:hypothetical protein
LRWHLAFRRNNEAFPSPHIIGTKASLPPLLERNPELKRCIMEYAKQNLNDFSAEIIYAKGRKDELQILCKQKSIPIEEELDEVVEGWEGKPKGMLQILWERGFIDPAKKKEDYTLDGKKDKQV